MPSPSPAYKPSPSDYADIFIAAVEGGINYWAAIRGYEWKVSSNNNDNDYATARIYERNNNKSWLLDSRDEEWHDAVTKAAEYFGTDIKGFIENHDAADADVAMQFATLGEVIYS